MYNENIHNRIYKGSIRKKLKILLILYFYRYIINKEKKYKNKDSDYRLTFRFFISEIINIPDFY